MTILMHLLEGMAAQAEVPALIHALGWTLLHFCWQGAVVAALLWCVLALVPVRLPQARYAAASLVLALMVALPVGTFVRLAGVEIRASRELRALPIVMTPAIVVDAGEHAPPEPLRVRIARALDASAPWVPAVWLAGVVVFLARLNLGLIVARRMRSAVTEPAQDGLRESLARLRERLGVTRAVRLVQSAMVEAPTVIGWLRPVVLIPVGCLTGLSAAQVEAILAHELAHIRRHDYLVSVLQSVVEALLFYHPAVWWASKQMRRERESCCDDVAVKLSGDRIAYARALSWLEENRTATPELVLGANGGVLTMRIRRLLGLNESATVSRGVAITLLSVVAVVTIWYAGTIAHAQSGRTAPASSNAAQSAAGPAAAPIPSEIDVDQSCRIVTMDLSDPAHPRPHYRTDLIICHTESEKKTLRWEETIDNGVKTKRRVDIREHEFLLQNPYPQPITFVVRQALPTGYHIDSDPQPNDVTNSIATFRVLADPGQTVRLHVGWSDEVLQENSDLLPVKQIGNGVSAPVLTHSVPPEYTPEAKKAKTEGTVLVNLVVNEKGRPENVHARLQTAAPATDAVATLAQERGAIEGTIIDPTGALVPRAQVAATNTDTGVQVKVVTDNTGKYSLSPLPTGPYNVEVVASGFLRMLQENVHVGAKQQVELDFKLTAGGENTTISVTGAPGEASAGQAPTVIVEAPASNSPRPQRVSAGVVEGNLISKVDPVYPDIAKKAHVQGSVVLRAVIAKDGTVKNLTLITGPPMLVVSAIEAVQQWKYKPYLLNGEPTEVETTITVNYSFSPDQEQPGATSLNDGSENPRRIGGSISTPVPMYVVQPEYTQEAREAKVSGTVLVNLIVDGQGSPQNVHILRGLGDGLDEKAVEAVKQYKFKPAMLDGRPVPVKLNVEVNFKLF